MELFRRRRRRARRKWHHTFSHSLIHSHTQPLNKTCFLKKARAAKNRHHRAGKRKGGYTNNSMSHSTTFSFLVVQYQLGTRKKRRNIVISSPLPCFTKSRLNPRPGCVCLSQHVKKEKNKCIVSPSRSGHGIPALQSPVRRAHLPSANPPPSSRLVSASCHSLTSRLADWRAAGFNNIESAMQDSTGADSHLADADASILSRKPILVCESER